MLKGTSFFISLKEYVIITLGMLLYIVGWSVFLVPNQLVGGGVSGLASVVQYATNGAVKMGYTYFVVNVVLLIIAIQDHLCDSDSVCRTERLPGNHPCGYLPDSGRGERQVDEFHHGWTYGRCRYRIVYVTGRKHRRNGYHSPDSKQIP